MAKRAGTRSARAEETRAKIFRSAIELIKARGYKNVTIDEICTHCGVTKGAFYYHFTSKDSIIDEAYVDADRAVMKNLPGILNEDSLLLFVRLSLLYAEQVEYKGVEIMKQILRHNLEPAGCNRRMNEFYNIEKRPMLKVLASAYKRLQETGKAKSDVPFERFFRSLIVVNDGVVLDWCYFNGSYDLKEAMRDAILRFLVPFAPPTCLIPQ